MVPGRCADGEEVCLYRRERGEPHHAQKRQRDSTRGGAMTRAQHCGKKPITVIYRKRRRNIKSRMCIQCRLVR